MDRNDRVILKALVKAVTLAVASVLLVWAILAETLLCLRRRLDLSLSNTDRRGGARSCLDYGQSYAATDRHRARRRSGSRSYSLR